MAINPLIITCAVVGAELTKEDYPYLPTTPKEIAESARGAVEAGASIIHLHVRDEQEKPSQRVDIFREVTKKYAGIVNVSCSILQAVRWAPRLTNAVHL